MSLPRSSYGWESNETRATTLGWDILHKTRWLVLDPYLQASSDTLRQLDPEGVGVRWVQSPLLLRTSQPRPRPFFLRLDPWRWRDHRHSRRHAIRPRSFSASAGADSRPPVIDGYS